MELEHSFTVPVPKERAWDVLLDVEKVAPCMPGATLDSVDGDVIHGKIKVKVGPISMTYAGKAEIVERDEAAGVVRLDASGKETKGAGTASATVRSVLEGRGQETHVTVYTTLNVTGKPAQFGRGVMSEVSGKLIGIFANNLAAMISEPDEGDAADGDAADAGHGPPPSRAAAPSDQIGAGSEHAALDTSIDDLHLGARAAAALHRDGISTVGQLAAKNETELLALDGIGPASVDEIKSKLAEHGVALGAPVHAGAGAAAPASAGAGAGAAAGAGAGASTAAANGGRPASGTTAGDAGASAATNGKADAKAGSAATPSRRRSGRSGSQEESLNLLKVAGVPVLKRSIPVLAGVTAVLIIGWRRKSRRKTK